MKCRTCSNYDSLHNVCLSLEEFEMCQAIERASKQRLSMEITETMIKEILKHMTKEVMNETEQYTSVW